MEEKQRRVLHEQSIKNNTAIVRSTFEDTIHSVETQTESLSNLHSPPNAKGTLRYINLVTNMRTRLCEEYNWKSDNRKNSSFSISPDKSIALMIRTGNNYTGNPDVPNYLPKTNNQKISKASLAIHNGQDKLKLNGSTELLILLHRKSKDGKTMHVELSRISELDGQQILSLSDRQCFSINLDNFSVKKHDPVISEQEDFIEEDFIIKRK